jgi:hypothetical protein
MYRTRSVSAAVDGDPEAATASVTLSDTEMFDNASWMKVAFIVRRSFCESVKTALPVLVADTCETSGTTMS